MKHSPLLASGLALAVNVAEAEPLDNFFPFNSEAFTPGIVELNESVPRALVDLQQCVRNRFAVFGLENADGSTSYMFNRPQSDGNLTYDFVFPEDLSNGASYLGRYKNEPLELFGGQVLVPEDPDFNQAFDYPITPESLLNNGYIAEPESFATHFQTQVNRWNDLCQTGALIPIDLPADFKQFWDEALALHATVRSYLEQCLKTDIAPVTSAYLNNVLTRFGDLEVYPELGLEDPYEMTFKLQMAFRESCAES